MGCNIQNKSDIGTFIRTYQPWVVREFIPLRIFVNEPPLWGSMDKVKSITATRDFITHPASKLILLMVI